MLIFRKEPKINWENEIDEMDPFEPTFDQIKKEAHDKPVPRVKEFQGDDLFSKDGKLNQKLVQEQAEILLKFGEAKVAYKMFDYALDHGESNRSLYYGLAQCSEQLGRFEEAQFQYSNALSALDLKKKVTAQTILGKKISLFIRNKKDLDAIFWINKALSRNLKETEKFSFNLSKAKCLIRMKEWDKAKDALTQIEGVLTKKSKAWGLVQEQWGWLFLEQGEKKKAKAHFQKALTSNPRSSKALYGIGLVHFKSKKMNAAIEYFEQSLKISNEQPKVLVSLVQACLDHGKPKLAFPYLKNFEASPSFQEIGPIAGKLRNLMEKIQ